MPYRTPTFQISVDHGKIRDILVNTIIFSRNTCNEITNILLWSIRKSIIDFLWLIICLDGTRSSKKIMKKFTYSLRHCDLVQLQGFLGLSPFDSSTACVLLEVSGDDIAAPCWCGVCVSAGEGCCCWCWAPAIADCRRLYRRAGSTVLLMELKRLS